MADANDDPEVIREAMADVWRAANAANLSDAERDGLQRLMREGRKALAEYNDLVAAKQDFESNVRSALTSRLGPGLVHLMQEEGRPPTGEEIKEYLREAVTEAQAVSDQPLLVFTPGMGSRKLGLAELPDDVYRALGRLVVRFGQLEESVNMLLYYLGSELGVRDEELFTDDLSKKRSELKKIADRAAEKGILPEPLRKRLERHLDATSALAKERRRYVHAGYMLSKGSPAAAGWIRRAERGKPGIALEPLRVESILDLSERTKAAAEEGWSLFVAVLESNPIEPDRE